MRIPKVRGSVKLPKGRPLLLTMPSGMVLTSVFGLVGLLSPFPLLGVTLGTPVVTPKESLRLLRVTLLVPFATSLGVLLNGPGLFSPISSFVIFLCGGLSPVPTGVPIPIALPAFPGPRGVLFPSSRPVTLLVIPAGSPFESVFSALWWFVCRFG